MLPHSKDNYFVLFHKQNLGFLVVNYVVMSCIYSLSNQFYWLAVNPRALDQTLEDLKKIFH